MISCQVPGSISATGDRHWAPAAWRVCMTSGPVPYGGFAVWAPALALAMLGAWWSLAKWGCCVRRIATAGARCGCRLLSLESCLCLCGV
eukprot:scaffold2535_cov128-Isochrysis_galbana.AAC.1